MDHSLLDSVDDFVIVRSANDHSLPIRVRELPGKISQQDADLQNEDIDLVSRPGSVRSLDSPLLTACSLEDDNDYRGRSSIHSPPEEYPSSGQPGKPPNAPFVKNKGLPCFVSADNSTSPDTTPTSPTGVSVRPGQPGTDINIASIPEIAISESVNSPFGKFGRSCSSHSEMDKHLVDLLIDHAFQSRFTCSQEPIELSLRQSIMERLQSLPDQHPVIREAARRIDSEKQWAKASWFNPAAQRSIYEHIFSAVERAALSFLIECHESMEFAIPCAISIHKDMQSWSLLKANGDQDTVQKAFELACTIQSECNMDLSAYDLKIWKNRILNDKMNAQVEYQIGLLQPKTNPAFLTSPEEIEKIRLGVEHAFRQQLCKTSIAPARNTSLDRAGLSLSKRDAPEDDLDPISQPFNHPSKRKNMPGAFPNDKSLGPKVIVPTFNGSEDHPRCSTAHGAIPIVVARHPNPADRHHSGISSETDSRQMDPTNSNHIAPPGAVTENGPGDKTFASYNPTQPVQTSHTESVNTAASSKPIKWNDLSEGRPSIPAQDYSIQFSPLEQHRCETSPWMSLSNPTDSYRNAPPATQLSKQQFNGYQHQLMLLEQQNRQRLRANLGPGASLPPPTDHQVVANAATPIQNRPAFPHPMNNHPLQDYQLQLMLLEQHNKKRLAKINKYLDEHLEELCWLTRSNKVQCIIRNNATSPCNRVLSTRDAWKKHVRNDHDKWIRHQIELRNDYPPPFENESHSTASQLQVSSLVPSIRPQTPCRNQTGLFCSWPLSPPTQMTSHPFLMAEPQELPTSSDQPSKSAKRDLALEDYEVQLQLLEQHCKKRHAMSKRHDTEKLKPQLPTQSPKGEVMVKAEPHEQLINQEPQELIIKTERNDDCHSPYS